MRGEKKQLFSKITGDIGSYIDYLRENGVTEVISFAGRPKEGNAAKAPMRAALPPEAELKSIADSVAACTKCPLHEKRTRTVPGQGNVRPEILFIGEGPGEEEDRQGLAFVGRAGQLLTRLIVKMGYKREEVFIANIVKCRPPNNRRPLPEEMSACLPYLEEQIAVLKPKVIVPLGATALGALIVPEAKISKMRGRWLEYKGIPTMPTFHPSYLLRNQSAMWDVWSDMQEVLKHLGREVPEKKKNIKT